jgi:hypothetical protein
LNGVAVASSTYISTGEIRAVTPSISNGSYNLTLFNTNNTGAIYSLTFSGFPTWTTGSYTSNSATISVQLQATGDGTLNYYLQGGSTLPTGVTLSSTGLLSGTISSAVSGTVYSFTVLVDDSQLQTSQQAITLTLQFTDTYYKNTTLMLTGETSVTPFISDASTNSFGLTINGDTKPTLFSPYQGDGYYGVYFDGTGDYLTAPANAAWNFTGDWTFECWIYPTAITGYHTFLGQWGAPDNVFIWKMNSSGRMYLENLSTALTATSTTIVANQWQHIALTRSSNTIRMFVNGVLDSTTATRSGTYYSSGVMYVGASGVAEAFTGYISNMRILNGTALYTTTFTPPTAPLTAIANTSLLTCQSNRFLDKSTNNFTMTKAGDTAVKTFNPFQNNSGKSIYFDGTGDYCVSQPVNQLYAFGTGDFTIEAWIYRTDTGVQRGIVDTRDNSSVGILFFITTNNKLNLFDGTTVWLTSTNIVPANQWVHVAASRASGTTKLFINGAQEASGADTRAYTAGSAGLYIARQYGSTTNDFMGYIDDLRITKGYARYTSNNQVDLTQTFQVK